MEEAYTELYQQFLRLRSLCLRQAALLHQLTTVLQKERGAAVPNGQLSDMMSIPVQCTQEIPVYFHEKPQPLAAAAQSPAAQCGVDFFTSNKGTFSNLLAEDMAKLSVDMPHQRKEDDILEQRVAPLLSLESLRWPEASSNELKTPRKADLAGRDGPLRTTRMLLTDRTSLDVDFLSQSGGLLMSDVALQSHVCDFCQAVFPGDTTTRGEFLRHLHTHIT
ncbi:uncharacterized protein zgc:113184 [Anabas testudineus]|uniref:uncharacterized protein zgc:113184 n=1 Tax=Anabas testudineus TaxID=64144 RepID=UPI000E462633|nr:uncharacterized protein zgc:113184 [Anabas testudineus]XP_026205009.1 uncharacterized protein zgc:113184 [Anabas testudineus]XP_026205010.1 uncharacterized protein zgc:113184 [Anabas testudineus]XP_026205011.1 uncharacterized protein zgc:113184 [Anabas testudineus]XP_026205013.1 uncharacterized protein zgc:113184 [Anabas testudineus]XP_026205014.1 uncharacterized protein zgc:113184 [Anabas testudineus]